MRSRWLALAALLGVCVLAACGAPPAAPAARGAAVLPGIGQRVEQGGAAVTINGAEQTGQLTQSTSSRAQPGRVYVLLDATIENTGRERLPYTPLDLRLRDAQGYEYTWRGGAQDRALGVGDLARGERVRGTVAYDLPDPPPPFDALAAIYAPVGLALDRTAPTLRFRLAR